MDPVLIANVVGLTADLAAKYVKPGSGIPSSDFASAVQTSLGLADTALQTTDKLNRREYFPTIANAADTEHDLTLGPARIWVSDGTNERLIEFASLTKQIDAAWTAGTNQGGLDTGSVANSTWYYLWAIYNPTSGVADYLISASASSPTMPSGYTFKRLLSDQIAAAVLTNGSANINIGKYTGKVFFFDASLTFVDLNTASPATSKTVTTVTVPSVKCWYHARFVMTNSSASAYGAVYHFDSQATAYLPRVQVANKSIEQQIRVQATGSQIYHLADDGGGTWSGFYLQSMGYEVI